LNWNRQRASAFRSLFGCGGSFHIGRAIETVVESRVLAFLENCHQLLGKLSLEELKFGLVGNVMELVGIFAEVVEFLLRPLAKGVFVKCL